MGINETQPQDLDYAKDTAPVRGSSATDHEAAITSATRHRQNTRK